MTCFLTSRQKSNIKNKSTYLCIINNSTSTANTCDYFSVSSSTSSYAISLYLSAACAAPFKTNKSAQFILHASLQHGSTSTASTCDYFSVSSSTSENALSPYL